MEKNLKLFFLFNNASGWKTNEKTLRAKHNDLANDINSYAEKHILSELPFKEKIWHYINNSTEVPKCKNCGVNLKFGRVLKDGYGFYCSMNCTNKSIDHINKVKETNKQKYGSETPLNTDKTKEIIQKKYGVDNIFKDKEYIKNKTISKHGVDHIAKLESTKDKIKQTNKKKYGETTPLKIKNNRDKNKIKLKENTLIKYENYNITNIKDDDISIICDVCNKEYTINRSVLWHRDKMNKQACTLCNPVSDKTSIIQKEITTYIKELGFQVILSDRKILLGKELDILVPTKNVAIEVNGLYWHSDLYKDKNYHKEKTKVASLNGIRLIHIFEDEWEEKKDICKSRLANILGKTPNKVYGRKCTIKEITNLEYNNFMKINHIQGTCKAGIKLGLVYQNEIVAAMSFGKKRITLGSKSKINEYELLRFANKINTNVIGGADKLFKFFIKKYNPKSIISYADQRWSNGNLYKKLGFTLTKETIPNYWYVLNNKRFYRYNFRKDKLISMGYDKKKTEKQIMSELGYLRIYDVGHYRFEKLF